MPEYREDYGKAFVISFKTDKTSYDETRKLIDTLSKSLTDEGGFSKETLEILQQYSETLGNAKIEIVKKEEEVKAKEIKEPKEEKPKETKDKEVKKEKEDTTQKEIDSFTKILSEGVDIVGGKIDSAISSISDFISRKVKNFFSDLLRESINEINEINKYQYLSNRDVREQALTYGFNPAQNYAYSKVMDLMGLSDTEDLMFLRGNQRAKFQEKFEEYSDRYSKLYDSGLFDTLQDFTWEWAEFKEDLEYEIIDFFMTNKDLIKDAMTLGIDLLQRILNVVSVISDIAGGMFGRRASTVSDIINNSVSNANTNVKIDNTFNNVAKADQQWLSNAGELTYQQIITALGGR